MSKWILNVNYIIFINSTNFSTVWLEFLSACLHGGLYRQICKSEQICYQRNVRRQRSSKGQTYCDTLGFAKSTVGFIRWKWKNMKQARNLLEVTIQQPLVRDWLNDSFLAAMGNLAKQEPLMTYDKGLGGKKKIMHDSYLEAKAKASHPQFANGRN